MSSELVRIGQNCIYNLEKGYVFDGDSLNNYLTRNNLASVLTESFDHGSSKDSFLSWLGQESIAANQLTYHDQGSKIQSDSSTSARLGALEHLLQHSRNIGYCNLSLNHRYRLQFSTTANRPKSLNHSSEQYLSFEPIAYSHDGLSLLSNVVSTNVIQIPQYGRKKDARIIFGVGHLSTDFLPDQTHNSPLKVNFGGKFVANTSINAKVAWLTGDKKPQGIESKEVECVTWLFSPENFASRVPKVYTLVNARPITLPKISDIIEQGNPRNPYYSHCNPNSILKSSY